MELLITSNSFGKNDPSARQRLRDAGWDIRENPKGTILSESDMVEAVRGVDAIILGSDPVTSAVLDSAPELKLISRYGVGIDNIDMEAAKKRGVDIRVTRAANAEAVADFTLGLVLSLLRHIPKANDDLQNGTWKKRRGFDLYQKTVGVIGCGAIGRRVISRLKGFQCKILGYDLKPDSKYFLDNNIKQSSLEEILEKSDIITLHVPNASGVTLIGEKELAKMKPDAVLVNTARGGLVDEQAVLRSLKSRNLYGYGADVFSSEPEIPSYFNGCEDLNLVLTPHMAAVSAEATSEMTRMAVDNVLEYFQRKGNDDQ